MTYTTTELTEIINNCESTIEIVDAHNLMYELGILKNMMVAFYLNKVIENAIINLKS